jgi:hypothetical protein
MLEKGEFISFGMLFFMRLSTLLLASIQNAGARLCSEILLLPLTLLSPRFGDDNSFDWSDNDSLCLSNQYLSLQDRTKFQAKIWCWGYRVDPPRRLRRRLDLLRRRLDIRFISTADQISDGFTKALSEKQTLRFRNNLNLIPSTWYMRCDCWGVLKYLVWHVVRLVLMSFNRLVAGSNVIFSSLLLSCKVVRSS